MSFLTAKQKNSKEFAMAVRTELLALAGIDTAEQAKGIQRAWRKINRQLESHKVELVTHLGSYQRVDVPDNASQLRAAEAILHMTGANAVKAEGESGDVNITIQFPAACQPTPAIDVTPQPVVVEALIENRDE